MIIKSEVDLAQAIKKINAADIIILEENSQGIISQHARLFEQLLNMQERDNKKGAQLLEHLK